MSYYIDKSGGVHEVHADGAQLDPKQYKEISAEDAVKVLAEHKAAIVADIAERQAAYDSELAELTEQLDSAKSLAAFKKVRSEIARLKPQKTD